MAELAAHIAQVTARVFPDQIWVQGQIRNLTRSNNGHAYFSLTEPTPAGGETRAQISVTLLAPERQAVNNMLKRAVGGNVRMTEGIEVRIGGRLRWYGPRGTLQLRMDAIDPEFTLGRLQADRDRLLAALTAEGLLERNSRLPMPLVPLRVAVVTSVGTAAAADVGHELEASGLAFEVTFVDARTQGPECGPSVCAALERIERGLTDGTAPVDVVLVVRGGGARTDLVGFDTEAVARAIATMSVPVLTGLGHQIDRAVADEVAHESHKTPTAAAASLVVRVQGFLARVDQAWSVARHAGSASADRAEGRLDRRAGRVAGAAGAVLARAERTVEGLAVALPVRAGRQLDGANRHLDGLEARTAAHDPARLLAKGWSITTAADGTVVRTPADVSTGDTLTTTVAGGTIASTVTSTEESP